jgi:vesicle coat complex subunit
LLNFGLDKNRLIDNKLFDVLGSHKLRVAIVNNLIDDLIYQYEVLPDAFFIKDTAEVTEDFHHPVQDIHNIGWRDIMLGSGHEVYSEFLSIEVVNAIHIKAWRRIALPELDLSKEDLTCFSSEIQTDYIMSILSIAYSL